MDFTRQQSSGSVVYKERKPDVWKEAKPVLYMEVKPNVSQTESMRPTTQAPIQQPLHDGDVDAMLAAPSEDPIVIRPLDHNVPKHVLPLLERAIWSWDKTAQLQATILLRKLAFAHMRSPKEWLGELGDAQQRGMFARLVSFMCDFERPALQVEAAWVLHTVASTTYAGQLVGTGVTKVAVRSLMAPAASLRLHAVGILGNIAAISDRDARHVLRHASVLPFLAARIDDDDEATRDVVAWFAANLCCSRSFVSSGRSDDVAAVVDMLVTMLVVHGPAAVAKCDASSQVTSIEMPSEAMKRCMWVQHVLTALHALCDVAGPDRRTSVREVVTTAVLVRKVVPVLVGLVRWHLFWQERAERPTNIMVKNVGLPVTSLQALCGADDSCALWAAAVDAGLLEEVTEHLRDARADQQAAPDHRPRRSSWSRTARRTAQFAKSQLVPRVGLAFGLLEAVFDSPCSTALRHEWVRRLLKPPRVVGVRDASLLASFPYFATKEWWGSASGAVHNTTERFAGFVGSLVAAASPLQRKVLVTRYNVLSALTTIVFESWGERAPVRALIAMATLLKNGSFIGDKSIYSLLVDSPAFVRHARAKTGFKEDDAAAAAGPAKPLPAAVTARRARLQAERDGMATRKRGRAAGSLSADSEGRTVDTSPPTQLVQLLASELRGIPYARPHDADTEFACVELAAQLGKGPPFTPQEVAAAAEAEAAANAKAEAEAAAAAAAAARVRSLSMGIRSYLQDEPEPDVCPDCGRVHGGRGITGPPLYDEESYDDDEEEEDDFCGDDDYYSEDDSDEDLYY